MKLSIVCVSDVSAMTRGFLLEFQDLARTLGAEFVMGAHGGRAIRFADDNGIKFVVVDGKYFEELIDPVISVCTGDYVLRLDDDERISSGMLAWLKTDEWHRRDSWFFSRAHLWPDAQHCLAKQPYFPDFQARLSVARQARRPVKIHAAHAYPAYRAPAEAYLEHHVFLIRTREERQAITAKYETIRTGQYFDPANVTVVMPYDDPNPVIEPVASARCLELAEETVWWRQVGQRLPANLDQELREWRESRGRGAS
jgi:hypothetical protein